MEDEYQLSGYPKSWWWHSIFRLPWRIFPRLCSMEWCEISPCPSNCCLCQQEVALQPSPLPPWRTVTNFVLCRLQQNFYLHIVQMAREEISMSGRGWRVDTAAGQHPSCCWGRRHNICVLSKGIIPCPVLAAACPWWCRRRWGVHLPCWPRGERCLCTFQFTSYHIFFLSAQSSRFLKGITLPILRFKAGFNEFDEPV